MNDNFISTEREKKLGFVLQARAVYMPNTRQACRKTLKKMKNDHNS